MLKSIEMKQELETLNKKAKALLENKEAKLEEIQAVNSEIEILQAKISVQEKIEADEKAAIANKVPEPVNRSQSDEVVAFYKALRGEKLTDIENALVTGGANGENLIIPQDIHTQITELRRQYKSARMLVGSYPTTTLTGSFVYEDGTTTELTNFTDGADIPDSDEPKFNNVSYAIKDYGSILPVSNRLLQNEAGGLVPYLGKWFNRKAIRTENKKIFAQLKAGKTVKALADWKALKSSLNKDMDPAFVDVIIATNQDGFDYLDSAMDSTGRPILQPNPTDATKKMFMGYPVEVFSNTELPTVAKKVPIFYGSTQDGVTFVDRNQMYIDASEHAGFKKNQTLLRVIEQFDVIDADKASYIYGEFTIA
ncbi:phage major capsid protein [Bacillus sp. OK048]|uniref:phage major capsid protein n=1 Tax=Bacillus sp. OK048 TaxID=1882761 RepID=UPI00088B7B9C|nr:phage major capsid protein [Bacillus sp. OK048]SDM17508.1 phage major capsid protein, HK97 family [Bacillus sp. OK048]